MTTLETIKAHGEQVIDMLKRGESLSANDRAALKIYNQLYAKKAGNAGMRNGSKNIQKSPKYI